MTDKIKQRDPKLDSIVEAESITDISIDTRHTNRFDMTDTAAMAHVEGKRAEFVEPVKIAQRHETARSALATVRSALALGLVAATVFLGKDVPPGVLIAAITTCGVLGLVNGEALSKLIDKWTSKQP